jgi:hypothetical protein
MKKYIFIGLLAVMGTLAFSSHSAHAFSIETPASFVQPDTIFLDQNGNLEIQWHKIQLGLFGYDLPGGIMVSINGTSTDPELSYNGPYAGWSAGGHVLTHGGVGTGAGCAGGFGSDYSGASEATYGNTYGPISTVWNADTNSFVPTLSITQATPIYLTFFSYYGYQCGVGESLPTDGSTYWQIFYVNSIEEPVQPEFLQPFDGAVIGQFPNWDFYLSNNSTSSQSGVVTVHFGTGPGNLTLTASTTYEDLPAGTDTELTIPQTYQFSTPQGPSSSVWYADIEVANTSTDFDITGSVISFTYSNNAPASAPFPNGMFNFGGGETSSTAANCDFTSSTFLDDPIGNLEEAGCNLFIPNTSEQADLYDSFHSSWDNLSTRVPFGYASIITTAFQNFQEGTNTSTLIATTTYAALSSVLDPLKTGISFMLILMLGFWIFKFIQHITL